MHSHRKESTWFTVRRLFIQLLGVVSKFDTDTRNLKSNLKLKTNRQKT